MLRSSRALRSGLPLHRLVAAVRTAAPVSELSPLVSSLSVSVNETSAIAAISSAACKVFLSSFFCSINFSICSPSMNFSVIGGWSFSGEIRRAESLLGFLGAGRTWIRSERIRR